MAAPPKTQTFGVISDSIMSVVRRAIFHISSIDGAPLGGIFVELSGGESKVGIDGQFMPLIIDGQRPYHLHE
jgi:hypothetical protein